MCVKTVVRGNFVLPVKHRLQQIFIVSVKFPGYRRTHKVDANITSLHFLRILIKTVGAVCPI